MSTNKPEEILKNDPITKAVDAANEILRPYNLKVNELRSLDGDTRGKAIYQGKVYFNETIDAALEAAERGG